MTSISTTEESPLYRMLRQEVFVHIHDGWRMLAPRGWVFMNGHHTASGDDGHEFHWRNHLHSETVRLSLWMDVEGKAVYGFIKTGERQALSFHEAGLMPHDVQDTSVRNAAQIRGMIDLLQRDEWMGHAALRPLFDSPEAVSAVCAELAFLASQCESAEPDLNMSGENMMRFTEHQAPTKAQRDALNEQRAMVQMIPVHPGYSQQNTLQMFIDGVLIASSPSYTQLSEYLIGLMQQPDDEEDEA